MALRRIAALLLLVATAARADEPVPPEPVAPPADFEPPRVVGETTVPYPEGAPPHDAPIAVQVKLLVDVDGSVKKVDLVTPGEPVFDEAVVRAASAFRFEPARAGGQPVPVEIAFTHTFLPPPPPAPPPDTGPATTAVLRGRLRELGTRAPLASATVVAQVEGRAFSADSDGDGRFRLPVPPGTARITVHAPGYLPFLQKETLEGSQEVAVTYYVERERYDPYEILVYAEQRREEVSRVTLRDAEIKQVPGTFGDPFRVVQSLPGVSSMVSLLPFPVVRGSSPSSTGFLLDGTRVPLLYHLLGGPSVIHPELIDAVDFFPGGAPVGYGGYTGGIVDGRTRRARAGEKLWDLDANLLEAGGLLRQPVLGATVTAAARYGYPGFILGLATNEASLSYWDYQLRVDGGNPRNGWTVFAFGARDVLETPAPDADPGDPSPPLAPSLILGFHRLDVRAHHGAGRLDGAYRLVLGYDRTLGSGSNVTMFVVEPTLRWRVAVGDPLVLAAGLEGAYHDVSHGMPPAGTDDNLLILNQITDDIGRLFVGAAFVEALWRPSARWLVRPGVRASLFDDGDTSRGAVEPRLSVRYRPGTSELWLKAGLGLYSQPPRFVLPLPGLDTMPLRYGLSRAVQSSVGAEIPIAAQVGLEVEAYASYLDPTIFDLAVNREDLNRAAAGSIFPGSTDPPETRAEQILDRLLTPQIGRAYGVELLLRRQSKDGLYGWMSYTLSRSERERDGAWVPYDFDRTHLFNLVAGIPFRRNWDLGVRLQLQSGKPATTTAGYNTTRTDGYARIDVRVDKRVAWQGWLLDFYVDIANVALLPEEVSPGRELRYVLPTLGVRGRF